MLNTDDIVVFYPRPPAASRLSASTSLDRNKVEFSTYTHSNFSSVFASQTPDVICVVSYAVRLILGDGNDYSSPSVAFQGSVAALTSSVSSGNFSSLLRSSAAAGGSNSFASVQTGILKLPQTFSSTIVGTPTPTWTPTIRPSAFQTLRPSQSNSTSLSLASSAGVNALFIVELVAGGVGALILFGIGYFFIRNVRTIIIDFCIFPIILSSLALSHYIYIMCIYIMYI